jgi:hypothetical protein
MGDIAIILPPVWAQVYNGVARFLHHSLRDLGINSVITDFKPPSRTPAIVLGWNLYPADWRPSQPYVLYQLEPLCLDHWRNRMTERRQLLESAQAIWDYSTANVALLKVAGGAVRWLPITYHPALRDLRSADALSEYDILFTGVMTPRRQAVIERLTRHCCVYTHSRWGAELLDAFSRSKIVLNIHQHDGPMPLEQVRVSHALNQGAFVLSEVSADEPYPFLEGVPIDALADRALDYLFDPQRRRTAHDTMLAAFEQGRTAAHLAAALEGFAT